MTPSSGALRRLALQAGKERSRPAAICLRSLATGGGGGGTASSNGAAAAPTKRRDGVGDARRDHHHHHHRRRHQPRSGGMDDRPRPPPPGTPPEESLRRLVHHPRPASEPPSPPSSSHIQRGADANHPPRQRDSKAEGLPSRIESAANHSDNNKKRTGPLPPGSAANSSIPSPSPGSRESEGKEQRRHVRKNHQTPQGVLRDLAGRLVRMQNQLDRLGPLPPIWDEVAAREGGGGGGDGDRVPDARRAEVAQRALADLRGWVKDLRGAVAVVGGGQPSAEETNTSPGRVRRLSVSKHGHELAVLLERAARVCGDAAAAASPDAHYLCQELLELMAAWGLNWQQRHVDSAILAAARAGRWEAAAALFEAQIDPDRGNRPVDVSVAEPVGLYAVARHWQESTNKAAAATANGLHAAAAAGDGPPPTVADRVLEAANRMAMLSPTDQEAYLLAAGTALGRAGEWRDLVQYLRTNPRAEELGQPLVVAAMHACILCDRHEEALQLYDEHVVGHDAVLASDWQWAGGELNRLNPLCRDLAMRAMGGTTSSSGGEDRGVATRALDCYWSAMEEGVTVSLEALCGVAEACRNEGRWEDAMSVFFSVLTKSFHVRWLVPGSDLSITSLNEELAFHPEVLPSLGPFVGSVLRACNDAGHFATAALAVCLLHCSLSPIPSPAEVSTNNRSLSELFLPMFDVLHQKQDSLLAPLMESLVSLGCTSDCLNLFSAVSDRADPATLKESRRLLDSIRQTKTTASTALWPSTFIKAHRFMICFQSCVDNEETVTEKEAKLMATALASLVAAFTAASQSQAGITLATWVDLHTSSSDSYLPLTDGLAGSLIDAHTHSGNYRAAVELFRAVPADANNESRLLTYTATIKSLFRLSRASEAVELFETVVKHHRSPDLMSAVASGFVRAGEWSAAVDVYRLALAKGCLSEEVGLLAIKSVSAGRVSGRFRTMRNIIEEVSGLSGTSPNDWIELKYWDLKRLIGFSETARLMWWSDPQTRHLDELNFAFQCLEKRKRDNITPKNDALRLIASAAKSYQSFHVPEGAAGLSFIPRRVSDWKRALKTALDESQHSSLFNSRNFIESVAMGFVELGSFEDATRIIDDAIDRGLDVERSVLYTASQTATGS